MSFFIGVYSLSGSPVRAHPRALEAAAALPVQFRLSTYCDPRLVLLHGDLGVLPEDGWTESDHTVGAAAGALLPGDEPSHPGGPRDSALHTAVTELNAGRASYLRNANGTYALCAYDKRTHRLTLAGDSLGARPLYYAEADGQLYFATSIDALVRLEGVPRTHDVATYIEEEALCYPLGSRTKYAAVKVVVDSEAVVAEDGTVTRARYFDWRSLPVATESVDELAASCRAALRAAVASRSAPGMRHVCLLSGGLDSRVLAAELSDLGRTAAAINVSPEGAQDQVYARRFAERAKMDFTTKAWTPEMSGLSASDCTATLLSAAVRGLEPGCAFSGDGGGEVFGFLLLKAPAGRLLNEGKVREAVDSYLGTYAPSRKLYKPAAFERIRTTAHDRMEAELQRIGVALGEKALHIFVLTNDLRRHLHEYFNRLPQTRVELLLPFYDRRVIASVLRIPPPLEPLMKHAFYYRLLALLPGLITTEPWQTYPGHLPCPVADHDPPPDQWSIKSGFGDTLVPACLAAALAPRFAPVLQRSTVLAAVAMHRMRLGDFTHLFKTCLNLQERCGGEVEWVLRNDGFANEPSPEPAGGR